MLDMYTKSKFLDDRERHLKGEFLKNIITAFAKINATKHTEGMQLKLAVELLNRCKFRKC